MKKVYGFLMLALVVIGTSLCAMESNQNNTQEPRKKSETELWLHGLSHWGIQKWEESRKALFPEGSWAQRQYDHVQREYTILSNEVNSWSTRQKLAAGFIAGSAVTALVMRKRAKPVVAFITPKQ